MDRRLDIIRIIGCFMVVLVHACGSHFYSFNPTWAAVNFFDSLSRPCVPLFFMLSGATLLNKVESPQLFLKKRATRILPPFLFWSVFYLFWLAHFGVRKDNWVATIIAGPTVYHLWYFYAIIGLYLTVPILRPFYQSASFNTRLTFVFAWFAISSVYPQLFQLVSLTKIVVASPALASATLTDTYSLQYFSGYVGYLFLGAFLADVRSTARVRGLAIYASASAGTMYGTYWLSHRLGAPNEFFYTYLSPLVIVAAAGLFSACMAMPEKQPATWMRTVSGCTLGIYGIHPIFVEYAVNLPQFAGSGNIPWIGPVLTALEAFCAALIFVWTLRLIKPLRWVM